MQVGEKAQNSFPEEYLVEQDEFGWPVAEGNIAKTKRPPL